MVGQAILPANCAELWGWQGQGDVIAALVMGSSLPYKALIAIEDGLKTKCWKSRLKMSRSRQ